MKQIKINVKYVLVLGSFFMGFFSNAQELEALIEEALMNNPEIEQASLQYSIASEKVNETNNFPNTEFGVGYFVSEPETRTGPQTFKVSVKQMIPWFGSITARENYTNAMAEAAYEDVVIAKRKLIASISQVYYSLYTNKAKQNVLLKNVKLLETYETLALTAVEVGKASTVDVLRLQMRQNELEQLKQVLQLQYLADKTSLNKLLNRDKETAISVVDSLMIPPEYFDVAVNNISLHPELIKYDKLYRSVEQSEFLNQKEKAPMIGFGLDYINVDKRPNMDFNDNGKDILMPMVSVSIPIFNKGYNSVTKQNELKQQQIKAQQQERFNALETRLDKAIKERASARINYNTQTLNLKQAKDAETILMKSYESGIVDFKDILDIQELQLKFQMGQIEATNSYYTQTAIINYLTN
ncbi:TolC family protein [Flavobacteriaceae bacterium XHP0103]|uniref:TolC family protein n=1 Tax=Marixanthotalea marina TaxID=2844359 RepID=UPI00298A0066|nr:TolC family protein [Marixanthotalea marina]MBU3822063.1 TolC family protein [Marixanthotalea marina]